MWFLVWVCIGLLAGTSSTTYLQNTYMYTPIDMPVYIYMYMLKLYRKAEY